MLYHKTEIFLFNLVARTRISLRKRTIFVWTFSVINFGSRRKILRYPGKDTNALEGIMLSGLQKWRGNKESN